MKVPSRPARLGVIALCALFALAACGGGDDDDSDKSDGASGLPAPVADSPITRESPAKVVPDDSGIEGVVAYDTLPRGHVKGPVKYSVTPPVGGDHHPVWMNCGVYSAPVPSERAVHNLEHGAIWITYQPDLAQGDVDALRSFVKRQSEVEFTIQGQTVKTGSHYIDVSPFPGLPSPIVISAWAHQLKVDSPSDPRLQRFVETFRTNPKYSPEYPASCGRQPPKVGGTPDLS